MASRDLLLFNIHRIAHQLLTRRHAESLGLLSLAATLEQHGYEPVVWHGEPAAARAFFRERLQQGPLLAAGFFCDFDNQSEVRAMSAWITEQSDVPVLLGGPQTIAVDAAFLTETRAAAAVIGEGEETVPALLKILADGGELRTVPGLRFLDEQGELVDTGPARLPKDLDALPFPAYHRWLTRPNLARKNSAYVMSGRGCPHRCAFCYEGSLARRLRLKSIPRVLEEVEHLLQIMPGLHYVVFSDDTLNITADRVRMLCAGLKKLRERHDFVWYCEGHIAMLAKNTGLLAEMVDAGLVCLQLGIESGVQEVLDLYGKGITTEQIETVVAAAAEARLPQIKGFFLTGGAMERPEHLAENQAFCEKLIYLAPGIISLGPSPLMPYPGTDIAKCPEKYGVSVVDGAGLTSLADYPVTANDRLSREDMARRQQQLVQHIVDTMRTCFHQGLVPHQQILTTYHYLYHNHDMLWHQVVYSQVPFMDGFYKLLERGAIFRSQDIAADRLMNYRPQRILEIWHSVDFSLGFPRIGADVLSPLEFELLLYATGKQTLAQVLDTVYEKFSERIPDRHDFTVTALSIYERFEQKWQLAYAPL